MALSADKLREYEGTPTKSYGPAAASSGPYYVGALLCYDAAGRLVPAADTANYVFAGICTKYKDNSSGSAGDIDVEFEYGQVEKIAIGAGGVSLASNGDVVVVADDEGVSDASTETNDVEVGEVVRFETGFVWVRTRNGYAAAAA